MEGRIKIVHIAIVLSGVETYIRLVAQNIDESKFDLVIIRDKEKNQVPITYNSGKPVKTYEVDFQREIHPLKDSKLLVESTSIVKQENPSLIHCHSAKGGIIGRTVGVLLGLPVFYTPHAFSFLSFPNKLKAYTFQSVEKIFSKTNSYLIACSKSEAYRAIHDVNYPENRTYIINNSLPKPLYPPSFNSTSNYICSIGRPSYQKNTLHLLEIFKEINKEFPKLNLYILGVGYYSPDLDKVKSFIEMNDLNHVIKLYEWTSREETLSLLDKSLFYFSLSRYEGLSYAVLEAMSLGKPCLLSNVDGNKDCIENQKSGLLIDLDSSIEESATSIIELLRFPDKIIDMGKAAYQNFIQHFIIEKNIHTLESLYIHHSK